jgi:hypothetical protein
MSSEAYPGGSGTGCGQRTVLTSPVPGVVAGLPVAMAGLPVAIAIFNFWNAGTTSRRHAE